MWIGAGASPLCQFFLFSSSLSVMLLHKIVLHLLSFLSAFMSSDKFLTPAPTVPSQLSKWKYFPLQHTVFSRIEALRLNVYATYSPIIDVPIYSIDL